MSRAAFSHEVMFYGAPEEFLEGTVPFLRAAAQQGEPALVAVRRSLAATLKAELGGDAQDVRFFEMEVAGRNPARIIPLWRDFIDRHASAGGRVRGIGEPVWPGRAPEELDECRRHESLLNLAFDGRPAWRLLCPYDSGALPDQVLEAAHDSHPWLWRAGERRANGAGAAADAFAADPFAGELSPPPAGARTLRFGRATLHEARSLVAAAAEAAGLPADRVFDLVAAGGELLANSVMHGGGEGTVSAWLRGEAVLVEVRDEGRFEQPLAGRLRPLPEQHGGRGLWLANHLCDLVQIRSGPGGTAVRLRMDIGR